MCRCVCMHVSVWVFRACTLRWTWIVTNLCQFMSNFSICSCDWRVVLMRPPLFCATTNSAEKYWIKVSRLKSVSETRLTWVSKTIKRQKINAEPPARASSSPVLPINRFIRPSPIIVINPINSLRIKRNVHASTNTADVVIFSYIPLYPLPIISHHQWKHQMTNINMFYSVYT